MSHLAAQSTPSPRPSPRRRGVALLLALVCLSIVSVAGVSLLRVSADASIDARQRDFDRRAATIARDAERLALAWLSPGAPSPGGAPGPGPGSTRGPGSNSGGFDRILDAPDRDQQVDPSGFVTIAEWSSEEAHVQIEAIDLSGRLHVSLLGTRAATGLPAALAVHREADAGRSARSPATRQLRKSERAAEPETMLLRGLLDSLGGDRRVREFPVSDGRSPMSSDAAVLWITTIGASSNPGHRSSARGRIPPPLNVDTAPLALLEAALAGRDPTARARALAARREGIRVPADALALLNASNPDRGAETVTLSNRSSAVGFLVTVRSQRGAGARRFWIAAVRADGDRAIPSGSAGSSTWRVIERRRAEG